MTTVDLRHWHKADGQPSELLLPSSCCTIKFGQEVDRIDREAATAREDAVHAERRRVVLGALAGIEAYWNAAASALPPDDRGTQLAAAVVKQCLNTVRQVGCICPMIDVTPSGALPGSRLVPGGDPRCGVHGGE